MANRVNISAKGTKLDYDNWGVPITQAVNDHDAAIIALQNPGSVVARRVAAQSIPNNAMTPVACDTEDFDNANYFIPTSSIFTLPFTGRYLVNAGGNWAVQSGGDRMALLFVNGVELIGAGQTQPGSAANIIRQSIGAIITVVASATVALNVFQSSGSAINYTGRVSITYLGA